MSPLFLRCDPFISAREGGFTDDSRDPGNWTGGAVGRGALKGTKYGIAASRHPDLDIRNLTPEAAEQIRNTEYWLPLDGDALPAPIALVTYDAAINSGVHRAAGWLQRVLGVFVDGRVGAITASAAHVADPLKTANAVCDTRLTFLRGLDHYSDFGDGWEARVKLLRAAAAGLQA